MSSRPWTHRVRCLAPVLLLACGASPEGDDDKDWFDEVPDDGGGGDSSTGSDGGSGTGSDGGSGSDDGSDSGSGGDGASDGTGSGTDPEPDPGEAFGIAEVQLYELDCHLVFEIWATGVACEDCTVAFDSTLYLAEDSCGLGAETVDGRLEVFAGSAYWNDDSWGAASYGGGTVRWESDPIDRDGYTVSYWGYLNY